MRNGGAGEPGEARTRGQVRLRSAGHTGAVRCPSPPCMPNYAVRSQLRVSEVGVDKLRRFVWLLLPASIWLMAAALLWTTAVALWIGLEDLFWPVSLAAQFLGLFYLLGGLAGIAGLVALASPPSVARPLSGREQTPWRGYRTSPRPWQIASVFGGAIAGFYIDVTIIRYSLGYRIRTTWTFAVLALLCFCLACVMLPKLLAVWKSVARGLKGFGLSVALLGLIAQFWYVGVYAPENTPVGIDFAITVGPTARSGDDKIIQVNLTMEDAGSVAAVALGSMVVVSGISYPDGTITTLKVLKPISDASFLLPGDTVSYDFPVIIAKPGINALRFALTVDFARTSWLILGQRRGSTTGYYSHNCTRSPSDTRSEWYVVENHVHSFAQGPEVLYSDYCEHPVEPIGPHAAMVAPFVAVGIDGARSGRLVSIPNPSPAGSDLGILRSFRSETLLLS